LAFWRITTWIFGILKTVVKPPRQINEGFLSSSFIREGGWVYQNRGFYPRVREGFGDFLGHSFLGGFQGLKRWPFGKPIPTWNHSFFGETLLS